VSDAIFGEQKGNIDGQYWLAVTGSEARGLGLLTLTTQRFSSLAMRHCCCCCCSSATDAVGNQAR